MRRTGSRLFIPPSFKQAIQYKHGAIYLVRKNRLDPNLFHAISNRVVHQPRLVVLVSERSSQMLVYDSDSLFHVTILIYQST